MFLAGSYTRTEWDEIRRVYCGISRKFVNLIGSALFNCSRYLPGYAASPSRQNNFRQRNAHL